MEEKDEGFTLIELLVVIIIIGILAAIAIPVFLRQREKGYQAAIKSDIKSATTAEETYATESAGGIYTDYSSTATTNLTNAGFHTSTDVVIAVKAYPVTVGGTNLAFCISGSHPGTAAKYYYDSQVGNLVTAKPTNCP
jgi:type IV pilus assembly protein PilA